MYDLVWDLIKIEVDSVTSKADFWKNISEVTLLGGIINRSALGGEDYFQPLAMKSMNSQGELSLYDEVFGDLVTPSNKV